MTEYVNGFLFDRERTRVVLIHKTKPEWQKGLYNGVGGKIEEGETPAEAQRREFKEEAGLDLDGWQQYVTLAGGDFAVHFFRAFSDLEHIQAIRSETEEQVYLFHLDDLADLPTIPNLQWLIPMALSIDYDRAKMFTVNEVM